MTPALEIIESEAADLEAAAATSAAAGMYETGARQRTKAEGLRRAAEILRSLEALNSKH